MRWCAPVYDHLEEHIRLSAGPLTPQFISMQYSKGVAHSCLPTCIHVAFILQKQLLEYCLTLIFWSQNVGFTNTVLKQLVSAYFLPSNFWEVDILELQGENSLNSCC